MAQEALCVVELHGVVQLVLAIVEVAVRLRRREVPVVMASLLHIDRCVHDRVVG